MPYKILLDLVVLGYVSNFLFFHRPEHNNGDWLLNSYRKDSRRCNPLKPFSGLLQVLVSALESGVIDESFPFGQHQEFRHQARKNDGNKTFGIFLDLTKRRFEWMHQTGPIWPNW